MNKTISTVNVDESIQNFFKDYFFQQLPFSMASIKILPFFYAIVFFFFNSLSFCWHKGQERGEEKGVHLRGDGTWLSLTSFLSPLHDFHNLFQ